MKNAMKRILAGVGAVLLAGTMFAGMSVRAAEAASSYPAEDVPDLKATGTLNVNPASTNNGTTTTITEGTMYLYKVADIKYINGDMSFVENSAFDGATSDYSAFSEKGYYKKDGSNFTLSEAAVDISKSDYKTVGFNYQMAGRYESTAVGRTADREMTVPESGNIVFENLPTGLYLVRYVDTVDNTITFSMFSFLISVPNFNDAYSEDPYNVFTYPKPAYTSEEEVIPPPTPPTPPTPPYDPPTTPVPPTPPTPTVLGAVRDLIEPIIPQGEVLGATRLPQTGQLWWPVPVLAAIGVAFMAVGTIRRKHSA